MKFICKHCGVEFETTVKKGKPRTFCSNDCRYLSHNKKISVDKSNRVIAMRACETREDLISAMKKYISERIIKDDECWMWCGTVNRETNSGTIKFRGKTGSAPRLSWRAYRDYDLPRGRMLYKMCGNSLCVNPDHLYVSGLRYTRTCLNCGIDFKTSKTSKSIYCSRSCANKDLAKKKTKKFKDSLERIPFELKLKKLRLRIEATKEEDLNGCWNWTGTLKKGTHKYGRVKIRDPFTNERKMMIASRVSYLAYNGKIPTGMNILHLCDNPQCVNPKHLYAGTSLQNSKDIKSTKAKRPFTTKLTIQQARTIKHRLALGVSMRRLASEFEISSSTVQQIKDGKTWRDV